MNNNTQNNIYLFDHYLLGILSEKEEKDLSDWINTSEQNHQEFKDYVKKNQFYKVQSDEINQSWEKFKVKINKQENKKEIILPFWFKIAAIFVFSFVLGGLAFHFLDAENLFSDSQVAELIEINAPKGSRSYVKLPDGSKVWLNSDSKLFYSPDFGKKDRIVELQGEAYFDVEKNAAIPFRVNTSKITVNVTGTMFNLKAYPEEKTIETTLDEGEVILKNKDVNNKKDVIILKPKQRAIYNTTDNKTIVLSTESKQTGSKVQEEEIKPIQPIKIDRNIDTELYTSWKDNKLIFRNEKLFEVFVRLERWYGVKINVKDAEILNYHFNGTIENETITQVMKIIQYTLPIQFEIEHKEITIDKK